MSIQDTLRDIAASYGLAACEEAANKLDEYELADPNPPAFPFAATDPSNVPMQAQGMSLRDYFAAKAVQGLLAMDAHPRSSGYRGEVQYAGLAYEIADAMLKARATGETP